MSAGPKPVELTESEKADLIDAFQDGYLMSTDPMTSDLTQLGIVVTRIKAAARREALLEAREDLVAELVCCDVYERLSEKSTTAWTPEERNEYQHHSICYWGSASAELVRALAEPERDEPCPDVTRVDHAADHYAMTGRDNYRCERDEEGR